MKKTGKLRLMYKKVSWVKIYLNDRTVYVRDEKVKIQLERGN